MIVCSCNVISDAMIKATLDPAHGKLCPSTPGAVYKCLGRRPCCGRCFATVRGMIKEKLAAHRPQHVRASSCDEHSKVERGAPSEGAGPPTSAEQFAARAAP